RVRSERGDLRRN
ncbi:hydroxyethylthiazole kinase family protein, partial [Vibrio parahaemolyticus V-223/04]